MAASIVSSHCMPCGGVNQSLTHHSSASIAAFLAPLLFGTIFCTSPGRLSQALTTSVIRPEHYYFVKARFQSYTGSSTAPSSKGSTSEQKL